MREKWLRSFGSDKEIFLLEKYGPVVMYMTRDKPDGSPFGRSPAFHVWRGDNWLYCGSSRQKATAVFADAVKGGSV